MAAGLHFDAAAEAMWSQRNPHTAALVSLREAKGAPSRMVAVASVVHPLEFGKISLEASAKIGRKASECCISPAGRPQSPPDRDQGERERERA